MQVLETADVSEVLEAVLFEVKFEEVPLTGEGMLTNRLDLVAVEHEFAQFVLHLQTGDLHDVVSCNTSEEEIISCTQHLVG